MKKAMLALLVTLSLLALSSCAGKAGGGEEASGPSESPSTATAVVPAAAAVSAVTPSPPSESHSDSPAPNAAQPTVQAEDAGATADGEMILLEGTIGTYKVHMMLSIKDGVVTGSYYYDNPENNLKLSGSIEMNRILTMQETDPGGEVTGTFDGWYVPGIRLSGGWTDAKTGEYLDFSLKVKDGISDGAVWAGEWMRMGTGRFAHAFLVIFNETEVDFDFQMEAFYGAHNGFIQGKAVIDGAAARFCDKETTAELLFTVKDGIIEIVSSGEITFYAGANVTFDGQYTADPLPEDTLLSLGYLPDKASDDAFRAMVGGDYVLFLNTAQIYGDTPDLDGLGARAIAWGVVGMGGYNESIVMFLPNGCLCAAVIEPEKDIIRVYTDDPSITAVPKTIESWAGKNPELPVEFIAVKN